MQREKGYVLRWYVFASFSSVFNGILENKDRYTKILNEVRRAFVKHNMFWKFRKILYAKL